jgi:LPS-assembly protein
MRLWLKRGRCLRRLPRPLRSRLMPGRASRLSIDQWHPYRPRWSVQRRKSLRRCAGWPRIHRPSAVPQAFAAAVSRRSQHTFGGRGSRSQTRWPAAGAYAARRTRPRGPPLALRMAKAIVPLPIESEAPRPVFLSAQRISGLVGREVLAEDDGELRKAGTLLTADRLTYWPIDDEVDALGHVRLQQDGDLLTGSKGRLKLESQIGFIEEASYLINRQASAAGTRAGEGLPTKLPGAAAEAESTTGFAAPRVLDIKPGQTKLKTSDKSASEFTEARGEAERIDLEGENQIRMTAATYTTCPAGNDDWYLGVTDLKLDYDNDVGTGRDATVRFLDMPILYSPWLSFALNDERKSGFLVPSYGSSDTSGIEFSLPYYWNIAPNMDATIEPRILSKRGVQFGGDFRYVNEAYGGGYSGKTTVEYLPDDRQAGIDRWGVALNHSQLTANGFSAVINYNRVSDNDYYTDLSSQVTSTSRRRSCCSRGC